MTYCKFRWRIAVPRLLSAVAMLAVAGTHIEAQTRFIRRDTTPDYTRYRFSEQCMAAAMRIQRFEVLRLASWIDTTEITKRPELDTISPRLADAAKRCMAKFDPSKTSFEEYQDVAGLFLMAQRDAAADTVFDRALATVKRGTPGQIAEESLQILGKAIGIYAEARPIRYAKIQAMIRKQEREFPTPIGLFSLYATEFRYARIVGDTPTLHRAYKNFMATFDRLTEAGKAQKWYRDIGRYYAQEVFDHHSQQALIDSLRRGADAYIALKKANWIKATGNKNDPLPDFVGRKAPQLAADFWFIPGQKSPSVEALVRPTPGKVGLVVFIRGSCRSEAPTFIAEHRVTWTADCWDTYAAIRRFGERFPGLEMTIASHTAGYLGESPPVDPQTEAQMLRTNWNDYQRLPATIGVVNAQFDRLTPVQDNRRVDRPLANVQAYTFGAIKEFGSKAAYLVDVDGTILEMTDLVRNTEPVFKDMLEVLMQRKK